MTLHVKAEVKSLCTGGCKCETLLWCKHAFANLVAKCKCQCKLDILWNLKSWDPFYYVPYIYIYIYDSPANVFLNSLALCFSLILLTLVCLTFQSLSFAGCGKAWHSLGADIDWCTREQSSVQCTLSPALATSWSVRRTGFNQSGQPIQNQESETQVCVKQARKLGWSDYLSHLKAC